MQIHNLKREHKNKKDRLVGRGGKHAKTSGRGGKGQTARAGNKRRPELRDIIKKLPKNRGYAFKSFEIKPVGVSLDKIVKFYPEGGVVTPASLYELKAIKKRKGWIPQVKILGGKEKFSIKIEVSGCLVSNSAKEAITKAGGKVEEKKAEKKS
ncbi:MAG: uL15 family ribosomal protein [Candidatus Pacebacteria bacterium]|nr:uL15 family ribosomal protein [Candidatus Paceibacterota bacterium]